MTYFVTCSCGKAIAVSESQACLEIPCRCGQLVSVPPLDRLRATHDRGASNAGIVGKIRQMISDGDLPWEDTCAYSGQRTTDRLDFVIECEGPGLGTKGRLSYLLDILASRIFGKLLIEVWRDALPADDGSRVVAVRVPLLVGAEYHGEVLAIRSQRRLREMLRCVPIYEDLLTEYPNAGITVMVPPLQ